MLEDLQRLHPLGAVRVCKGHIFDPNARRPFEEDLLLLLLRRHLGQFEQALH